MALIAHFIDTRGFGGKERLLVDLADGLRARGHSALVLHFANPRLQTVCSAQGIADVVLGNEPRYRSRWGCGLFALGLAAELRRHKVALLHSHCTDAVVAGAVAATLLGIPHVGTLYERTPLSAGLSALRLAAAVGSSLVIGGPDGGHRGRARGAAYAHIAPGIDAAAFAHAVPRRGELFTFITTGQLIEENRIDWIIDALAHTRMPVRLRIVGEGPLHDALRSRARTQGVFERVEFAGFQSDMAVALSAAHAFVRTAQQGGPSLGLMEAMAAGLPAVVTHGAAAGLVEHGITGWLIGEEPTELAAAMDTLAGDPVRAAALGKAAQTQALRRYGLAEASRAYEELYGSLLPQRVAGKIFTAARHR